MLSLDSVGMNTAAVTNDAVRPRLTRRSRRGCLNCREARVKCNEVHPVCGRCCERSLQCEFPNEIQLRNGKHRNPREYTSCDHCRTKKLRCDGYDASGGSCQRCIILEIDCKRESRRTREAPSTTGFTQHASPIENQPQASSILTPDVHNPLCEERPALGLNPTSSSNQLVAKDLLTLYFATVHNFGYLSFIHEVDFWERYDKGQVSPDLCLAMAANALRFGNQARSQAEDHAVADSWVAQVNAKLFPKVMKMFDAIDLMTTLLCQNYEFLCGRYSTGYLMSGVSLKMMMLLRLHDNESSVMQTSDSLLSPESLRRLAWAVYMFDSTISGGAYGQSSISAEALTIRLPSDERVFLQHTPTITEYLDPFLSAPTSTSESDASSHLGIGAHVIRAMAVRQLVAGLHSRIQRRLISKDELPSVLLDAERRAARLLGSLPSHMSYSKSQFHVYKEQRPMVLVLHVSRINTRRHLLLLKSASSRFLDIYDQPILPDLVQEAKNFSSIFADAIDLEVVVDPQLAMHAYHGIEILLFQAPRCIGSTHELGIGIDEMNALLGPLIQTLRRLSKISDLIGLLYPEAVNRMIRKGYINELTNEDIDAVLRRMHSISNADVEFDFDESFWRYEVSLARLHGAYTGNGLPIENLVNGAHPPVLRPYRAVDIADAGFGDLELDSSRVKLIQSIPPSELQDGSAFPASFDAGIGPLERLQNVFDCARSRATTPPSRFTNDSLIIDEPTTPDDEPGVAHDMWCDSFAGFDPGMALFDDGLMPNIWSTCPPR